MMYTLMTWTTQYLSSIMISICTCSTAIKVNFLMYGENRKTMAMPIYMVHILPCDIASHEHERMRNNVSTVRCTLPKSEFCRDQSCSKYRVICTTVTECQIQERIMRKSFTENFLGEDQDPPLCPGCFNPMHNQPHHFSNVLTYAPATTSVRIACQVFCWVSLRQHYRSFRLLS